MSNPAILVCSAEAGSGRVILLAFIESAPGTVVGDFIVLLHPLPARAQTVLEAQRSPI